MLTPPARPRAPLGTLALLACVVAGAVALGALVTWPAPAEPTPRPVGPRWELEGRQAVALLAWTPAGIVLRGERVELRSPVDGALLWSAPAESRQVAVSADGERLAIYANNGWEGTAPTLEWVDLATRLVHPGGEATRYAGFSRLRGWAGDALVLEGRGVPARAVALDARCGPDTCPPARPVPSNGRFIDPGQAFYGRAQLSPDGTRVAATLRFHGSDARQLEVRPVPAEEGLRTGVAAEHVAWSPDGGIVAVFGGETVAFYAADTLAHLSDVRIPDPAPRRGAAAPRRVAGVGWTRDGARLFWFGGGDTGFVALPPAARSRGGRGGGAGVVYSPDGELVAYGLDHGFTIADADSGEVLVTAGQAQRW